MQSGRQAISLFEESLTAEPEKAKARAGCIVFFSEGMTAEPEKENLSGAGRDLNGGVAPKFTEMGE